MLEVKFDLAALTPLEVKALSAMLATYHTPEAFTEVEVEEEGLYGREPETAIGNGDNTELALPVAPEPQPEKVRKPRAKREAPAPEPAPVEEPTVEPEVEPTVDESAPAATFHTIETLREALKNYTVKHGMAQGIDLLKDFGCTRVSEIQDLPMAEQEEYLRCSRA